MTRATSTLAKVPVAAMFCDISGSTTLYRTLGDEAAEALVRGVLQRLAGMVIAQHGSVIKTIGDELMCRFPTGADAALAAIEMQRKVRAPVVGQEGAAKLRLRIGFAAGQAVEREGDLFGDVVNIASRLSSLAKADQILTDEATADGFAQELKSGTRPFDKAKVKGIADEISVVQVLWDKRNQATLMPRGAVSSTATSTRLELTYGEQVLTVAPKEVPKHLGRADDCDVIVRSGCASRHHARIEYNRGKFMLIDESSNGTYVEMTEAKGSRRRLVYVRNEAFALVGSGRFSLGIRPEEDPHVLSFRAS